MRKIILAFFILMTTVVGAMADTVTIDTSGWTQEKKNMVPAMVSKILAANAITHSGINVNLPIIDVRSPSANISSFLTKQEISDEYDAWKIVMDQAITDSVVEETAKENELKNSELTNLKMTQVDTKIDAISNLSEMKNFLKKLVRYIKAREDE